VKTNRCADIDPHFVARDGRLEARLDARGRAQIAARTWASNPLAIVFHVDDGEQYAAN
jgi:hypothetical protein